VIGPAEPINGYGGASLVRCSCGVEKVVRNQDLLVADAHYYETIQYSFAVPVWTERLQLTHGQLAVKNYLTDDQKCLRTSLLPGLFDRAEQNLRWSQEFSLFELGRVFASGKGDSATDGSAKHWLPQQPKYLAGVVVSKERSAEQVYLDVKGLLLNLMNHYAIEGELVAGSESAWSEKVYDYRSHDLTLVSFGLMRPNVTEEYFGGATVVWWEIPFGKLVKQAAWKRTFSAFPKYPTVVRDIAVVVGKDCAWEDLYREVKGTSGLIENVTLFDIFQSEKQLGADKKSLAFSIVFRSPDKTLTSEDIEVVLQKILKNLKAKFQAEQR
jgi:phenylalanyl-tRNA synthetase beta chain